jgi:hypothetical protein
MNRSTGKARKEALFIRVPAPDNTAEFHDATTHIGKAMPFTNPKATCGMRVTPDAVVFSLLHLTKRAATGLAAKPLDLPRGPLARLERRVESLADLDQKTLVVDYEGVEHRYEIERDANGVLELNSVDEDLIIELPRSAVQVTLSLRSPISNRVLIVGFIGHVGKPGASEPLRRIAAMILFSISQLTQFRILSEVETVIVPSPVRAGYKPAVRKAADRAQVMLPVWLFNDATPPAAIAQGNVAIEIDLDQANHVTGRLLYNFSPDDNIAPYFDAYRAIIDQTVSAVVRTYLGDEEIKAITVDIVLGEVSTGTLERLRDALLTTASGYDFTTRLYQAHVDR